MLRRNSRLPIREVSLGQKIAGVFLVVMSCLIGAIGGLTAFVGVAFCVQLQRDNTALSSGNQWILGVLMFLGGVFAMFAGNVAAQVGAWIAGKNVWSHSQRPVRTACQKATFEIFALFGIIGSAAGVLWVSLLVVYQEFSTVWFALGILAFSLVFLGGVIWWSKREARKPI